MQFLKQSFKNTFRTDTYFILAVFILMGLTGGYETVSNGVEFTGKVLFSFYGFVIGLLTGLLFAIIFNAWQTDRKIKKQTKILFLIASIAPCLLIYFDFKENTESTIGSLLFLGINAFVIIFLAFIMQKSKKKRRDFFLNLTILAIWEIIVIYWFISVSWKIMGYWD